MMGQVWHTLMDRQVDNTLYDQTRPTSQGQLGGKPRISRFQAAYVRA